MRSLRTRSAYTRDLFFPSRLPFFLPLHSLRQFPFHVTSVPSASPFACSACDLVTFFPAFYCSYILFCLFPPSCFPSVLFVMCLDPPRCKTSAARTAGGGGRTGTGSRKLRQTCVTLVANAGLPWKLIAQLLPAF
jgi:hypothetical protein